MGVSYQSCEDVLDTAVNELFDSDPQIQAVGIARHQQAFGFKAVKNAAKIVPASAMAGAAKKPLKAIKKVPVTIDTVSSDIEAHFQVPHIQAASFIPERSQTTPLVCGLQIQNVDDDDRQRKAGALGQGLIIIGTLGCFVKLADGSNAILSNNHVLAGENRGIKGKDRILHPGSLTFSSAQQAATLTDFVALKPSPNNARPAKGNVVFNAVDAAVAALTASVAFSQTYLPSRHQVAPHGTGTPKVGDKVFKIGRTTGLTHGTITAIGTVVGPIPYDPGNCWFNQQFEIVGDNGTMFSDHGDSGSAILSTTGEVVGLLYAGNGTQTYACPIQAVLSALNCTLL
ncbi:Nal1-like putative serine protease [Zavarzinella formosa]|uniref:trypsin-like peptidase domain-containing protein n=1 Tax=Zavarzinella formosa TaxID=360055 RepID=UPI00031466B5|nr:trypsin-like peptidase domain-containing protein [Zavarzinella formosa]